MGDWGFCAREGCVERVPVEQELCVAHGPQVFVRRCQVCEHPIERGDEPADHALDRLARRMSAAHWHHADPAVCREIIRADEREKMRYSIIDVPLGAHWQGVCGHHWDYRDHGETCPICAFCPDLRAKVEGLPMHEFQERTTVSGDWGWRLREGLCRDDVLALLPKKVSDG